jgi:hypothetical protein
MSFRYSVSLDIEARSTQEDGMRDGCEDSLGVIVGVVRVPATAYA